MQLFRKTRFGLVHTLLLLITILSIASSLRAAPRLAQNGVELQDSLASPEIADLQEKYADPGSVLFVTLTSDPYFPVFAIVLFILILLLGVSKRLEAGYKTLVHTSSSPSLSIDSQESSSTYGALKKTLKVIIPATIFLYALYLGVKGTMSQGYTMEWMNLLIRWAHVVAGIMWIGASFYFIFLENNLNRTKDVREELAGNLWAVHGGGFYYLEKYKVAPKVIPKDLHWFKYEAYFTFLTGFALLVVVYYMDARSFLIDSDTADLSPQMAISFSILTLVIGWIVYDLLCKSRIIKSPVIFIVLSLILLTGLAFFLTSVFNSRAAYIHFGAVLGTIMVGNVYFNIIPAQKAMVKAAKSGLPLDPSLGLKAGQRSLHNNYMTLPVIYVMISNHFPSTYGHEYNWLVLISLTLISTVIKHYWNLIERGIVRTRLLIGSCAGIIALALVISPAFEAKMDLAIPVDFIEVKRIIDDRCIQCHSASPTDDVWKAAPNGVMYDTPEQVRDMSDKIMARAVRTKTMPQGNKTNMTDEERTTLRRWILQGSKIDEQMIQ